MTDTDHNPNFEKMDNHVSNNDPVIEDEPVIADEPIKKEKKTTLRFKIDPQLEYFPVSQKASLEQLKAIRQLFNQNKITDANKLADELNLDFKSEDEAERKTALRVGHWKAKTEYAVGFYDKALEIANTWISHLHERYPSLDKKFESADNFTTLDKAIKKLKGEEEKTGCTVTEITDSAIKLEEKDVPDYIIYIFLKF